MSQHSLLVGKGSSISEIGVYVSKSGVSAIGAVHEFVETRHVTLVDTSRDTDVELVRGVAEDPLPEVV